MKIEINCKGLPMFKYITLFVLAITSHVLDTDKINGIYFGGIEDKYKNTYPVSSNLEITDEGTVIGQYQYQYGGKNWNGVFYDGKLSGRDLLIYWKEEGRQGWLAIQFGENYRSFSGTWGSTNNNGNWFGER